MIDKFAGRTEVKVSRSGIEGPAGTFDREEAVTLNGDVQLASGLLVAPRRKIRVAGIAHCSCV